MSKVARTTLILMIFTMLSKVLGFGRELVLASYFGTSAYSDIFLTVLNIPNTICAMIGAALITSYIPVYYEVNKLEGEREALKFTNNTFNLFFIISILLFLLGLIFTEPLVKIFAMGFEGQKLKVATSFTKIMIIGIVFISLSKMMTSFLQVKNNFKIPGLIGIPYNIIIIAAIIISSKGDIYIIAIGASVAMLSQFVFQLPYALKSGYKYEFYINIKDKYIKRMLYLVGPVFIGVAVNQINDIVDRTLASTLIDGSLSALNYANRLNLFVTELFIASVVVVVYPMISKLASENNKKEFVEFISTAINSIILIIMPISIGAISLSTPIVKLLFERGEFDERATYMTATALMGYSIGMVAFGLRDILGKVFYSMQDTKTPMINGIIAVSTNIILNIILVRYMGHAGLAIATSISAIFCVVLLFIALRKKISYFGQDKIIKTLIKSGVAGVIMGLVVHNAYEILKASLEQD